MTIAITGATSMLGVATIKECIKQDIKVLAFARRGSANIRRLPSSPLLEIAECDLSETADFDTGGLGADTFIHFGWAFTDKDGRNDSYKQLANVQFALDALFLADRLGCRKFIGAGSQAEYGAPNKILAETTPVNPTVPYGVAKYAAGRLVKIECEKMNMEYNWVRILSVYGVNDNSSTLISQLVSNARKNIPMDLSGCEQTWDYLFEDDAGRAFVDIAKNGADGCVYNLASGKSKRLRDFVEEAVSIVNPGYAPNFGKYPYSDKHPFVLGADIKKLEADTGWKPQVSFNDGIKMIMNKNAENEFAINKNIIGGGI